MLLGLLSVGREGGRGGLGGCAKAFWELVRGRGGMGMWTMVDGSCFLIRSHHIREAHQLEHTWNGALSQEPDHWSALSSCRGLPESFGRKHLRDLG